MQRPRAIQTVVITGILTALWYVLSGIFDVLHFGTGVVTAFVIAVMYRAVPDVTRFNLLRCAAYLPWLLLQIIISNLRVAKVVLNPRMRIQPTFISQPPGVVGDRALTLLGASITLTPGTLTVEADDREIFVHALDAQSARDIRANVIAARVAQAFEERAP
jgi:multicomponent Na+:H+ antiporter subunit E